MKYVSDVIKYEQDIEPYRMIQIYAGVGAGKNAWVAKLVESGKRVLLVTSRKATADAQANKLEGCRWINLDEIQKPEGNNAVVVTNAGIEKYIKHKYNKDDEKTHLWKYFDIVVIDEAHSLVADATFSDAPFHVMSFVAKTLNSSSCKVILMTGTPDLLNSILNHSILQRRDFNPINIFTKCNHIFPENVFLFGDKQKLVEVLARQISNGRRMVYFANTIESIARLIKALKDYGVKEEDIGISFSDKTKNNLFSKELIEKMKKTHDLLITEERIPADIKIFITTSKNKEGINILDDDIRVIISESIEKSTLIQMAGRVRKKLNALFVLYASEPHPIDEMIGFERDLHKTCVDCVNKVAEKYTGLSVLNPTREDIVKRIEMHFPYIRYDYIQGKFTIYLSKLRANEQLKKERGEMERSIIAELNDYSEKFNLVKTKWFPESKVSFYRQTSKEEREKQFKNALDEYVEKNRLLEKKITKDDQKKILKDILDIAKSFEPDKLKVDLNASMLNPIIKPRGYKIEAESHHKGSNYILYKIA